MHTFTRDNVFRSLTLSIGGELAVRNAGKELVFDWSIDGAEATDESGDAINWAAFYSNCEHEVYEVTSGHRITLTYNLYVTRGLGHLASNAPALDSTQLPLHESLKDALDTPGFLSQGEQTLSISSLDLS